MVMIWSIGGQILSVAKTEDKHNLMFTLMPFVCQLDVKIVIYCGRRGGM